MAKYEILTEDFKTVEIGADSCLISFPYLLFNRYGDISEGFRQPRHFKVIHDMDIPPPNRRDVAEPVAVPSTMGSYAGWAAGLPKK